MAQRDIDTTEENEIPDRPRSKAEEISDKDPKDLEEGELSFTETDPADMDLSEAVMEDPISLDTVPDQADPFHESPELDGGVASADRPDLLPRDDESEDSDEHPSNSPHGPTTDSSELAELGLGGSGDSVDTDLHDISPDFDATIEPGNLTEHEEEIFDELREDTLGDPLDDPVVTGEETPEEYDLSGNEAGDGSGDRPTLLKVVDWLTQSPGGEPREVSPSQSDPYPGHKLVEGEGWVPLKDGEKDEDRTTIGEERLEAETLAEEDGGKAKPDEQPAEDPGDVGFFDWIASFFEDDEVEVTETPTGDYDPDSAPTPRSPTVDTEIADTHFGLGVEAERTSEVQFADMPEDGDDDNASYDGVDHGDEYTEPQLDIAEAEELIYVDVMDQPDVDPAEHGASADLGLEDAVLE